MNKEVKFHIPNRARAPSFTKLLEKMMPKKHSELFCTETRIIPGIFRCDDGSGIRVEVGGVEFGAIEVLLGSKDKARPIFVDAGSAAVLRDFFADLAKYI